MTRTQLRSLAARLYNEETGTWLTTTVMDAEIYEVMKEVAKETLCCPKTSTTNIALSTGYIILPADMFAIRQGGIQTTEYAPLPGPLTLAELQAKNRDWKTETGTVTHWYWYYDAVTVSGVTNWAIGLYPIPSAAVTNGITVLGFEIPDDFAGDSSSPVWPTPYHDVLAWGICQRAAVRDIERGQALPDYALGYFSMRYEEKKGELKAAVASQINSRVWVRGDGQPGYRGDEESAGPFAVVMIS